MSDETKKCSNCRFFANFSECHRHAPVVIARRTEFGIEQDSVFPRVGFHDWCGDFETKENQNNDPLA